jgi:FlaA1/EpsC-like NDP-sugar epimerase/lipopolysaccharide/colanic/teichoic acid biosynthesis glycosyltransferase
MVKRILDATVSLIGLIILAPVLAVIAVLIKLDSRGPVFFRGQRVGQYGKIFHILKFRSMVPDAPRKGPAITSRDDPRITRIGRLLRKTKLDELPSLVNVLKGEMSLVGPRPEAPPWVERYTPQQRAILAAKPGITGLAQIKYRNEEALLSSANLEAEYPRIMNDKLNIDLGYVENQSFIFDVRILLETAAMLLGWSYEPGLLKQFARRIAVDLVMIPCAFYLAWLIRFDSHVPMKEWNLLTARLLPIVFVYIVISAASGIYRHLWAYADFPDIILLAEAIGLGTLVLVVVNFALTSYYHYRLSTGGLITGGLLTCALSATVKYRYQLTARLFAPWPRRASSNPERLLIIGLNDTAQQLATQIYLGECKANYELVGFVEDDPDDKGKNLNGVKILGAPEQIPALVRDKQIDVIIIARQPSSREEMWQLISTCLETSAQVKALPDMDKVIEGGYQDPFTLRDVSIDDILGRTPITADTGACQRIVADKVVLVTGAAGSIGSELCRQILGFEPRLLLALDNNETGLYELNLELNRDGRSPVQLIMADVADWNKMTRVFQQHRPQVVFHAAAYKHVPLVESHPDEALRVNVMGTAIVSEVAHEFEAERFVFISTDKAVNPSSVMGASKRIGELWIKAMSERSSTLFTAVRFGNVIGSRGSVLPTFRRQIEMGGPVTVTHPEMHRFFISIPEAVSLVLQAVTFSQGGKVFMLDMGEEVSIPKLAERMIRLRGLRVRRDIEIKYTGARPGEKLHEELAYYNEPRSTTPHPRIYSLECPDGLVDHDTLLGVISILRDCLRLPGGDQHVRTGIFQVASGDIDGFLNDVTGLDLARGRRQLSDRADTRESSDKVVSSARPGHVAERTAAQFRGMSPPQLAIQTQSA